jgi:alkyl hydroperoxide reductase subunit AhpC
MNDQQDDRQAIDRISKSRESCHPVKKPNRALSDMCGNQTIKRYWLLACEKSQMGKILLVWRLLHRLTACATVVLQAALLSVAGLLGAAAAQTPEPLPGKAPDFQLPTSDGNTFRLSEHNGWVRVLFFVRENGYFVPRVLGMIENVVASLPDYERNSILVCIVATGADRSQEEELRKQVRLKWVMAEDGNREVHRLYKVIAVPTVVMVDKQGAISKRLAGYTLAFGAEFRETLRQSLGLPALKYSSEATTATRRSLLYESVGGLMVRRQLWSDALQNYQNALQINPELHAARLGAGFCLLRLGRSKEGVQEFQRSLEIDALSTRALVGLAWAKVLEGNVAQAQSDLENLRSASSGYPEYHEAWAAVHEALGEPDKAKQCQDKVEQLRGQPVKAPVSKLSRQKTRGK